MLADKYNVKPMVTHLKNMMLIKAKTPNLTCALEFYSISIRLGLTDLTNECLTTFKYNMESLINSSDWTKLEIDVVETLLKETDIIIQDELILFDSIIRWLTDKKFDPKRLENFESNSKRLIPLIRFSQLFETQLYLVENSNVILVSPEWFKQLVKHWLSKAYRFRCLEEVIVKLNNNKTSQIDSQAEVKYGSSALNGLNDSPNNNCSNQISLRNNLYSFLISSNENIPAGEANVSSKESLTGNSSGCQYVNTGHLVEPFNEWYIPRNYTETCMADKIDIKKNIKLNIQYDAKL
jgi:hypothetical protein